MKFVLAPYGTLGDVLPLAALARGLKEKGHEILFCAPPEYEESIGKLQLSFVPLGDNLKQFADQLSGEPARHMWKASQALMDFLKAQVPLQVNKLLDVSEGADCLIAASLNFGAPTAAEKLRIPYRFVSYCPQLFPSRKYPSFIARNHQLPEWINGLTWKIMEYLWKWGLLPVLNQERKNLKLTELQMFEKYWLGSNVLLASDPELGSPPEDVRTRYQQTGYMHADLQEELSEEVETFLRAGDPPVYAGFGSMIHDDAGETVQILKEVASVLKVRMIISSGWAKLKDWGERNCLVINNVSHAKLFPRVSAVIHHGGSGTTAAAARAGVPQVLIPHMSDQYYWANSIHKLRLGPKPVWRVHFSSVKLESALRECSQYRANTAELAMQLRKRDALSDAVNWIEWQFSKTKS